MTIYFDTIEKDGAFTVRDRDTLKQERINEEQLFALLSEKLD